MSPRLFSYNGCLEVDIFAADNGIPTSFCRTEAHASIRGNSGTGEPPFSSPLASVSLAVQRAGPSRGLQLPLQMCILPVGEKRSLWFLSRQEGMRGPGYVSLGLQGTREKLAHSGQE